MGFTAHLWHGPLRVREEASLPLDPGLEARVAEHWEQALTSSGGGLFDGPLLSVVRQEGNLWTVQRVRYREFLAQRREPDLFEALRCRPLAVSGLVTCRDGVVFGQRGAGSIQDEGRWELIPSGGVDPEACRDPNGWIEPARQLVRELGEEVGMSLATTPPMHPFAWVEDEVDHVIDLGYRVALPVGEQAVMAAYAALPRKEYDALRIVPMSELGAFHRRHGAGMVEVSRLLLGQAGLLDGA